jgi:CRP/FNR family transcriptional regulator
VQTLRVTANDTSCLSTPAGKGKGRLPCDTCPGRSLGICQPLDDAGLAELLSLGGRRRWQRHELLYRADDRAFMVYKITKGFVIESRALDDGRRQIMSIRAVGDLCGYPAFAGSHMLTAEALTEVEACAFDRRKFEAFAARHPKFAESLAADTSEKLHRASENMLVVGQLKSTERVAHFLVEMAELQADRHLGGPTLTLHLTRQEIADYVGLTLETVSRSFTKLRDLHVIALIGADGVALLDRPALADISKTSGTSPRGS